MAEKPKQILKLEPDNELVFKGPFTSVVTSHLKLSNPSDKTVCFKVKTTAPRRYCVRPNSGVVKGKESTDIAVMLQPFTYDPDEKNKHKFMVQSLIAGDSDDLNNLDSLFKEAAPKDLMDSKLKCVFDMPEEAPVKAIKTNETQSAYTANATISTSGVSEKLETELSRLKDENKKLKENEARLKRMALVASADPSNLPSGTPATHSNQVAVGGSVGMFPPILFMMIAFIIGLVIGKFVL